HQVFYPMGWDDNGLPTERRVQNYFGVRCDPSLPYDPDYVPPTDPPKHPVAISRPNFVALCHQLTLEDEQVFEHLWRTLALSVDWSHTYATIGERARRVSQRAFLRLARRGQVVQRTDPAPTPGCCAPGPTPPAPWRSRPPGPSCSRPAWPWSPIPTTIATDPCSARRSPRCSSVCGSRLSPTS